MKDPARFVSEAVEAVRSAVPEPHRALVAASGGIDSTVAAVIAHRALGARAVALFVDTGLLRKGEAARTAEIFSEVGVPYRIVPAAPRFFSALAGILDPERKRRAIGEAFIRVFEAEAATEKADFLVQGTIAPDWIESGGSLRDTIKTHHNVGGLPATMSLKVVEPLRDLYKDEVRSVAAHLGIPRSDRQPFPGPGLAVRVAGEVTPPRVEIVREAGAIVEEEVDRGVAQGAFPRPWQYFAVLLPVPTVGVTGDSRRVGEVISVRVVTSRDAMTATFTELPYDLLRRISERITREVSGRVVRVLYDVTDKPPATIEWE